jgi:signal transduction histidine kinase
MEKHKKEIGLKITIIVVASMLVFLVVSVGLSYFCLFDSSRDDTMGSRKIIANILAGSIADTIDNQAELIKINASTDLLKEAVESGNLKYEGMDAESAKRYILDIDSKRFKSVDGHPVIQEHLGNKASLFLQSLIKQKPGFFNILVVDRYGALIGASYKGCGFYYGDDRWFKEIVSGIGPDALFTEVMFDEPSGKWAFLIASAIVNDRGDVIGAYKALVDTEILSKPLEDFKIGKSGRAALIDNRGYLVFYPGVKPFSNKFCEYSELKKLLNNTRGYSVIDTVYMGKGKMAVAFSPVMSPMLSGNSVKLYVVVSENGREIFSPLNELALKMAIFSIILTLIVLITSLAVFKKLFIGPVKRLIDGMKSLGEGKFDHRVDIKTGDEIEDLGTALNSAAENLSHMTASIKKLDKEKLEYRITQQKFEKENIGFLSLVSHIHGLLLDINKGIELAKQEAVKSQNDKQSAELDLLHSRSVDLIKSLEKEIYAAKLENGSIEFKMEQKDLRDIIKETIFDFEPKIRDKGLNLKLDVPPRKINIYADTEKIKQVFVNLVDDAVKFTNKGVIEIIVKEMPDGIECSVSDTGENISTELKNRIFDRFQISAASSTRKRERGFGLFIMKVIIEMHKGSIRVESEPQKGTKFTFILPKYNESNK